MPLLLLLSFIILLSGASSLEEDGVSSRMCLAECVAKYAIISSNQTADSDLTSLDDACAGHVCRSVACNYWGKDPKNDWQCASGCDMRNLDRQCSVMCTSAIHVESCVLGCDKAKRMAVIQRTARPGGFPPLDVDWSVDVRCFCQFTSAVTSLVSVRCEAVSSIRADGARSPVMLQVQMSAESSRVVWIDVNQLVVVPRNRARWLFTVSGMQPGRTYLLRVRAIFRHRVSSYSYSPSIMTQPASSFDVAPVPPSSVSLVRYEAVSAERLRAKLTWQPTTSVCYYYFVWHNESHAESQLLYYTGEPRMELVDLSYDATYSVSVRAASTAKLQSASSAVHLQLSTPTCLEAHANNFSICGPGAISDVIVTLVDCGADNCSWSMTWTKPMFTSNWNAVSGYSVLVLDVDQSSAQLVLLNANLLSARLDIAIDRSVSLVHLRVVALSAHGKPGVPSQSVIDLRAYNRVPTAVIIATMVASAVLGVCLIGVAVVCCVRARTNQHQRFTTANCFTCSPFRWSATTIKNVCQSVRHWAINCSWSLIERSDDPTSHGQTNTFPTWQADFTTLDRTHLNRTGTSDISATGTPSSGTRRTVSGLWSSMEWYRLITNSQMVMEDAYVRVFRANYVGCDASVLIKTSKQDPKCTISHNRVANEIYVLSQLEHHPSIVRLYVGNINPLISCFENSIVMSFKQHLQSQVKRCEPLSRASRPFNVHGMDAVNLSYVQQVCDALCFLSVRRIAHRQLTTDRIQLCRTARVNELHAKLFDFGLACMHGVHNDGSIDQLPAHVVPPESHCHFLFNEATEIFGLGSLLKQVVSFNSVDSSHENDALLDVICPVDILPIIQSCSQPDPCDRPTAEQLQEMLRNAAN